MSWEPLAPAVRTSGRPMVSARLALLKTGDVSLTLFLSDFLMREFGEPKAVSVLVGGDENAGQMRLVFDPEGPFKVGQSAKAWRVTVPGSAFGDRAGANEPCGVVAKDVEGRALDLAMPVEAWARAAQSRAVASAATRSDGALGGGLAAEERGTVSIRAAERSRLSAQQGPQGRGVGRRAAAGRWRGRHPRPGAADDQSAARQGEPAAAVACRGGVAA